jgi:hypothetical protein
MLKISIFDTSAQRRLVLEGKLIAPWVTEFKKTWKALAADLGVRELVIDVGNLTYISAEGESALLELMRHGARFRSCGMFSKYMVQRLVRRHKKSALDQPPATSTDPEEGKGQK